MAALGNNIWGVYCRRNAIYLEEKFYLFFNIIVIYHGPKASLDGHLPTWLPFLSGSSNNCSAGMFHKENPQFREHSVVFQMRPFA